MFNLFPHEPAFFDMFNEAAQNMVLGSRRLKEMMESYEAVERKAREIKRIESAGDAITHTIISLENDADRITRDTIARLFEGEKDPMAVIKWKEIYESLEEGTDRCEDVANILERILLKHA